MSSVTYASTRFLFAAILTATMMFSVGIIALGVWILTDASLMSYWLNKIVATDYGALTATLRMTSYLPIGLGLTAIVSFSIGLSHLLRGGKVLLVCYAASVAVSIVLELILTLVPMGMWSQVNDELPQYMKYSLQNSYRGLPNGASHPNSIIWDVMQIELECCGYNGVTDYTKNYATYASYWHNSFRYYQVDSSSYSGMAYMFPVSCCKFSDKTILTNMDFSNYENYVSNKMCPVDGKDYFSNSCQQALKDYVYLYFCVILATSFVMLVLHVVSLILSIYLLKNRLVPESKYNATASLSPAQGRSTQSRRRQSKTPSAGRVRDIRNSRSRNR